MNSNPERQSFAGVADIAEHVTLCIGQLPTRNLQAATSHVAEAVRLIPTAGEGERTAMTAIADRLQTTIQTAHQAMTGLVAAEAGLYAYLADIGMPTERGDHAGAGLMIGLEATTTIPHDFGGDKPLGGLTFIANELIPVPSALAGTPRGEVWGNFIASAQASIQYARELGATIISAAASDANTAAPWMLFGNGDVSEAVLAEQEMLRLAPDIPAVTSQPFAECSRDALRAQLRHGKPFLLSYRAISMGHCKYLISTEEQLDTFLHFLEIYQDGDNPNSNYEQLFHVREFIPTPSDRYTSYRVLTTASGDIIAATLHYSAHTKGTATITKDQRAVDASSLLDTVKATLENPESPLYLNAPDVRSNLAVAGKSIPLMGGRNARPITPYEQTVLEAHGIDPHTPRPPSKTASPGITDRSPRSPAARYSRRPGLLARHRRQHPLPGDKSHARGHGLPGMLAGGRAQ